MSSALDVLYGDFITFTIILFIRNSRVYTQDKVLISGLVFDRLSCNIILPGQLNSVE
jgi:hypothetical protein